MQEVANHTSAHNISVNVCMYGCTYDKAREVSLAAVRFIVYRVYRFQVLRMYMYIYIYIHYMHMYLFISHICIYIYMYIHRLCTSCVCVCFVCHPIFQNSGDWGPRIFLPLLRGSRGPQYRR